MQKKKDENQNLNREQFIINDNRSLNEIMDELIETGYMPSFCTACYRLGTHRRALHGVFSPRIHQKILHTQRHAHPE